MCTLPIFCSHVNIIPGSTKPGGRYSQACVYMMQDSKRFGFAHLSCFLTLWELHEDYQGVCSVKCWVHGMQVFLRGKILFQPMSFSANVRDISPFMTFPCSHWSRLHEI